MPDPDDPFSRLNYRRLIAWPERIEREWVFLEPLLRRAPRLSVIDLGAGTGEHCRFLAERGVRAVGIDRSAEQVAAARAYEGEHGAAGPVFLEGAIAELPDLTSERFGMALCLGNVLPYLEDDELERSLAAAARALVPGGLLVCQLLNYQRILERKVRHLPLNFRPAPVTPMAPVEPLAPMERGRSAGAPAGEIVWLRLMSDGGPGHVLFHPTTLKLVPGADPPVEIHAVREVRLRAWTLAELEPLLRRTGFSALECFGDMAGAPYEGGSSHDLIFVATRA